MSHPIGVINSVDLHHNAGVRPIMYGCTVLQGGLTEDPISDDLVVVEALPFGHTEVCIVTDVFGENVIW